MVVFKALGSTDARVATVFLLEACAIGVWGVTGCFFGNFLAETRLWPFFRLGGGRSLGDSAMCLGVALLVTLGGQLPLIEP